MSTRTGLALKNLSFRSNSEDASAGRSMTLAAELMEEEDLQRHIEQHKKDLAAANERALIHGELKRLRQDVSEIKDEIIGDAAIDGIRAKVRSHDTLIRRLLWAFGVMTSAILATIAKWFWSQVTKE